MGIMIQPTKNRFGVYLVRKAVPKHLQGILNKREIKLTLDTKDVKEARERAPAKIIQIDMMKWSTKTGHRIRVFPVSIF
ncbi:DUF6538 domain-containing protein [Rahnella aceris]|uniref:DUF6538 domain-containing protein n=1 Tax=Rahnella sp. (strain Y9602) TaxID=2703885 RepID=UPI003460C047|nr:hypothetical protein [Rahnella aceris]